MNQQQMRTIIPAQPGWFVWFRHRDGGFAKEPVIAWEIEWDEYPHNKTTRPITIDSEVNLNIQMNGTILGEVDRYLICKPDGRLVQAGDGNCSTFASVKLSEHNVSRNE